MRLSQWVSLAAVATFFFSSFSAEPTRAAPQIDFKDLSMDTSLDGQFALIAPITSDSSAAAVAQWLDKVGEIMDRVALGGVASLPKNAVGAVETIANVVVHTDSLLQDKTVLRKVLAMTPAIWTSGYWYAPISTWKPLFLSVWTKSADSAKLACDQKSDHEAYDAAVNATSLMIRFTKDNYFLNGEKDTGEFQNALSKGYMAFLPEVVAQLSKAPRYSLSEKQLRAYMATIPSKRDGMDTSVAFPTFVDTARYKDSDVAALKAFLVKAPSTAANADADGTPAQNY